MSKDLNEVFDEYRRRFPPLITVSEAAEIARTNCQTIYAWSSAGEFDDFKIKPGRSILLHLVEFLRWLFDKRRI